jgi:LysM domain
LAAVIPAASIAVEPDRSQEGGLAPEQGQDLETDSPSFDPGGDTDLPFDAGPPPASEPQASPDDAPLESEPTDDPDGRLAPLAAPEAQVPGGVEDAPVRPVEGVQPGAPPTPGFSIEPPPSTDAPEAPPAPLSEPQPLPAEPGSGPKAAVAQRRLTAVVPLEPSPAPAPPAQPGEATPLASGSPEVVTSADQVADSQVPDDSGTSGGMSAADRGARVHVVRPGESLWTIAEGLLGLDASATSIAAEVARLWELNHELIPSGDPDLIVVGQELRLR